MVQGLSFTMLFIFQSLKLTPSRCVNIIPSTLIFSLASSQYVIKSQFRLTKTFIFMFVESRLPGIGLRKNTEDVGNFTSTVLS